MVRIDDNEEKLTRIERAYADRSIAMVKLNIQANFRIEPYTLLTRIDDGEVRSAEIQRACAAVP
jgi:hypothetical protein